MKTTEITTVSAKETRWERLDVCGWEDTSKQMTEADRKQEMNAVIASAYIISGVSK